MNVLDRYICIFFVLNIGLIIFDMWSWWLFIIVLMVILMLMGVFVNFVVFDYIKII